MNVMYHRVTTQNTMGTLLFKLCNSQNISVQTPLTLNLGGN
jgi:hypothetical protein